MKEPLIVTFLDVKTTGRKIPDRKATGCNTLGRKIPGRTIPG